MRIGVLGVVGLGLLTAGCGNNMQERTATGALLGVGIGAAVGGPVGAAVGLAAGGVGGSLMPEDATSIANNFLGREHRAVNNALNIPNPPGQAHTAGAAQPPMAATQGSGSTTQSQAPEGLIKEAQTQLKDNGLYNGPVDGIVGPKTRAALRTYQKQNGLRQTARLDHETAAKMNLAAEATPNTRSGSSMPSGNEAAPQPAAPQNAAPSGTGNPPPAPDNQPGSQPGNQ